MIECEYHKAVLDNGLALVAESHPHVRSVSVAVWIRVGSAQDPVNQSGVSHFIEHMVFKGTSERSALEIATVLESLGGELNAFTDREFTCFHATVLAEHLPIALDVLSDLVRNTVFNKAEIERERKVLFQELATIASQPDDLINDTFLKVIWGNHPLGQSIVGDRKSLRGISREHLVAFYEDHYRPENMVVCVAGRLQFDELKALVTDKFQFAKTQTSLSLHSSLPARYFSRRKAISYPSDQLHLLVGFEAVGYRHDLRFDILLLSFFLGGGMSSRLFQEIREKAGLAYSVDCDFVPFSTTGVFTIYASLSSRSLKQCLDIIRREIDELRGKPMHESMINIVKGQLKGTILLSSEQMEVRQESIGRNELIFGKYVSINDVLAEIDSVTAERVCEAAKFVFMANKEAIVTLGKRLPRLQPLLGVVKK